MPRSHQTQPTLGRKTLLAIWLGLAVLSLASPNPFLSVASLLGLTLIVKLLWRPGEPPALLFAMAFHWVQATMLTLDSNLRGLTLEERVGSHTIAMAAWLSLLGVLVVTLGMRVGAGKSEAPGLRQEIAFQTTRLSVRALFWSSLGAIIAAQQITVLASFFSPLRQQILALSALHWIIVYLFTYAVLHQHRGYAELGLVFAIELGIGFLGFFSGFKTVIFLMLMAALASPAALRGVRFRLIVSLSVVVLTLGLFWIAVKKDYRMFLNQGTGDQVVLVPIEKRISKLIELGGELDGQKLGNSIEALSDRLTYVTYFGESIQIVPDHLSYENGKLWWEAIENVLVPRFLNPNKRVINDSERTSFYTAGYVAGFQEGTSISLGYIAESYIDFGPVGMFLPLFLWGLLVGFAYRVLLKTPAFPLFGHASAAALVLMNAMYLETSNLKMLGGMLNAWLVLFLIQKFLTQRIGRLLTHSN